MSVSTYILVALQKLLLRICAWWHDSQLSTMLASVSSISGILVLGCQPSWCTLKFRACFDISHTCSQVENFTDTTSAKWEVAMNTPHKVKPVKTTLSNTCFVQITKFNQDLVWLTYCLTVNSVTHSSSASPIPGVTYSHTLLIQLLTIALVQTTWKIVLPAVPLLLCFDLLLQKRVNRTVA
jgi:hypothetical protein